MNAIAHSPMLDKALEYLGRGWSVFPVNGKVAAVDWKPFQTERPTPQQVREWFADDPTLGIAVALGRVSGLIRIDVDGPEAAAELERLGVPATLSFSTPSGGMGYLCEHLDGVRTQKVWKGDGPHQELRVQSDGAYTVLPPSPHPDGGFYQWANETKVARIPDWLRDRAVEQVLQELVHELHPTLRNPDLDEIASALGHIPADDYDTWIQVGMALHSVGPDQLENWIQWSKKSDKYVEGDCDRKWASFRCDHGGVSARTIFYLAMKNGWKSPKCLHEPLTDIGNGRMLARIAEGKIRHSSKFGWLAWDGKRWAMEDAEKTVQELQKEAVNIRLDRAADSLARAIKSNPEDVALRRRKSRTMGLILKHQDDCHIRGARRQAASEPRLSCDYRDFDLHPLLFNCLNGTLDLTTCKRRDHDPADNLTMLCPTRFDPAASTEKWAKFIEQVLPITEVRQYLKKFLGSCLTGLTDVQVMPVLWGIGRNGKSTLIDTLLHVFGEDYGMKASRELLMVTRGGDGKRTKVRLKGKRFVACVETEENGRIDETMVKELTGGDRIAARYLYKEEFEFEPTHKLVLVTNHKPTVRGSDDAIWRRLPLVEFGQKFEVGKDDCDPSLKDKLKAEASGVLNWLVEGCQEWLGAGRRLVMPDVVRTASANYRDEMDPVKQFIADRCEVDEKKKEVVKKLLDEFRTWALSPVNRFKFAQITDQEFGRKMTEYGYKLEEPSKKKRIGLCIRRDD